MNGDVNRDEPNHDSEESNRSHRHAENGNCVGSEDRAPVRKGSGKPHPASEQRRAIWKYFLVRQKPVRKKKVGYDAYLSAALIFGLHCKTIAFIWKRGQACLATGGVAVDVAMREKELVSRKTLPLNAVAIKKLRLDSEKKHQNACRHAGVSK